ncbi:hypothetical protein F5Y17DRAFT_22605 [Xylariaceae sp. FL0594]|nr:hypothetical protein F5Y17DRAFT_22605 [Xylariaceae sp. FL0594]
MALAAAYQQFLAAPDASHLADDATLNYITTTTTFKGVSDILQHLKTLRRQVSKKKEDVISVVEGSSAIAAEFATSLEFVTSGASYLPALDDNFLADRTVSLPIMHIVTFDSNGKILSIRQNWDQGALLKQLDIFGRTGHNWPIRDSKDQIKMIESCVKANTNTGPADALPASTIPDRSRGRSTNALRDPHASLSLFDSREEQPVSVISPRGGPRPRQRDLAEMLGDEPDNAPAFPSAGRHGSVSPNKAIAPRGGPRPPQRNLDDILGEDPVNGNGSSDHPITPKAGSGKNFQPSRLFEVEETEDTGNSAENAKPRGPTYRPNPKKYSHFEFSDGSDPQDAAPVVEPTPRKAKHNSQWSFEDFVTPAKVKPSKALHPQDAHLWDTGDEQASQKPAAGKARRDAEKHFDFVDDGNSPAERPLARPRGTTHNNGLGLYKNNVLDEDGDTAGPAQGQKPLGTITNMKDRGRDFEAHWAMDDNPTPKKSEDKPAISDDRKKAVKMMEPNWAAYDESPVQKENKPGGIAIGGDGMGGNKGSSRNWLFSDEDDALPKKPAAGRKAAAKTGGFNWDF